MDQVSIWNHYPQIFFFSLFRSKYFQFNSTIQFSQINATNRVISLTFWTFILCEVIEKLKPLMLRIILGIFYLNWRFSWKTKKNYRIEFFVVKLSDKMTKFTFSQLIALKRWYDFTQQHIYINILWNETIYARNFSFVSSVCFSASTKRNCNSMFQTFHNIPNIFKSKCKLKKHSFFFCFSVQCRYIFTFNLLTNVTLAILVHFV